MAELTHTQRLTIIKRRHYICDRHKRRFPASQLEIHHKDRNKHNNTPRNLRVLCEDCHDDLHRRAGW